MVEAGLEKGPCGIDELVKFQCVLGSAYQIKVFSKENYMVCFTKVPKHRRRFICFCTTVITTL